MGSGRNHLRAGSAAILAGFLVGAVVGLTACGGENPSARPSARASERSIERPASGAPESTRSREPDRTTEPAETSQPPTTTAVVPSEPTRTTQTTRTTTPAETTTRPPTSTAVVAPKTTETTRTSTPAGTTLTPAASASAAAAAAESQGLGPWGWLLVIALLAALIIGGLLVYQSQRRSAWDAEARALESETRTVTAARLPPVLSTTTTAERGLAWPPVRAALVDLVGRWNGLTERASGEARRNWSLRISGLLNELLAAVDAENEALAVGRDWTLVRPRVSQAEQALAAALAVQPQPEPPAAGEPGPTAFQT
jgi:hypothetical protein